jgi:hypothetical protein
MTTAMTDTRPRALTAEQQIIVAAGSSHAATTPMRIPPGTDTPIESLDPAAHVGGGSAAPSAGPTELPKSD